jgi:hypothetical protein
MSPPARPKSPAPTPDELRAAFEELHAPRLHGFALLITLGDRERARRLAMAALGQGAARAEELRHPERAAAWLRARVVRSAGRSHRPTIDADRSAALDELHVDEAAAAGLAALTPVERAAIVAAVVERLDRRDVGTVVGRGGAALERLLVRSRSRYVAAHVAAAADLPASGPITDRLHAAAVRALR